MAAIKIQAAFRGMQVRKTQVSERTADEINDSADQFHGFAEVDSAEVTLHKQGQSGFGVQFGGAKNAKEDLPKGIFISGTRPGSVAEEAATKGDLKIGWQVTSVNGANTTDALFSDLKKVLEGVEDTLTLKMTPNEALRQAYPAKIGSTIRSSVRQSAPGANPTIATLPLLPPVTEVALDAKQTPSQLKREAGANDPNLSPSRKKKEKSTKAKSSKSSIKRKGFGSSLRKSLARKKTAVVVTDMGPGLGVRTEVTLKKGGHASWGLQFSFEGHSPVITKVQPNSPAAVVNCIEIGMELLSINGVAMAGVGATQIVEVLKDCKQLELRFFTPPREPTSDEITAATKIQAGFRGMKQRKIAQNEYAAASKIQAGFRGMKQRRKLKEEAAAATRIQAGFRGLQQRRSIQREHAAATKIQAGFKGMKQRNRLRQAWGSPGNMEVVHIKKGAAASWGLSFNFTGENLTIAAIKSRGPAADSKRLLAGYIVHSINGEPMFGANSAKLANVVRGQSQLTLRIEVPVLSFGAFDVYLQKDAKEKWGITFSRNSSDSLVIGKIVKGSPAARTYGVEVNDVLIAINGEDTNGWTKAQLARALSGKDTLTLALKREASKDLLKTKAEHVVTASANEETLDEINGSADQFHGFAEVDSAEVTLHKQGQSGFGVQFGGAKNAKEDLPKGIFISGTRPGSVAEEAATKGDLKIGWQVTSVNGANTTDALFSDLKKVLEGVEDTLTLKMTPNEALRQAYPAKIGSTIRSSVRRPVPTTSSTANMVEDEISTDEEVAAAKIIQSGFRGMKARKKVNALKEEKAATKIQAGFRGARVRTELKIMQQEKAATVIQAGFRGARVRKEQKIMQQDKNVPAAVPAGHALVAGASSNDSIVALKEEMFLHPFPMEKESAGRLVLEAGTGDGTYMVYKHLSNRASFKNVLVLCVMYKEAPTWHFILPDKTTKNLLVNNVDYGPASSIIELINLLSNCPSGWPVALRFPVGASAHESNSTEKFDGFAENPVALAAAQAAARESQFEEERRLLEEKKEKERRDKELAEERERAKKAEAKAKAESDYQTKKAADEAMRRREAEERAAKKRALLAKFGTTDQPDDAPGFGSVVRQATVASKLSNWSNRARDRLKQNANKDLSETFEGFD